MKAYKGFNPDMTCTPADGVTFQYEEGKTYETDKAELCHEGFHACENPLDTFSYYAPGKGAVYHEVELDGVTDTKTDDSKRCGTKITIGARLSVLDLCKLHFEYTKERTTNSDMGEDHANLAAQNRSSLAARNKSSLAAQNWSSLAAQNRSSLAAGNESSLAAQNRSSLAAGNESSLAAQNRSSLAAQNWGSLAARNWSSLAARNWSSLAAQDNCKLSAGENSVIAAWNSVARAKKGTLIALGKREYVDGKWTVTDFKAAVVDGEIVKADTWYKLENGEFVEVEEP